MHIICFYVPHEQAEQVKTAMFNAGGGQVGNYSHCSFEHPGIGQFLPHQGAQPALGAIDQLERVQELKVEMVCDPSKTKAIISAMKDSHPYEEVAYHVIESLKF